LLYQNSQWLLLISQDLLTATHDYSN